MPTLVLNDMMAKLITMHKVYQAGFWIRLWSDVSNWTLSIYRYFFEMHVVFVMMAFCCFSHFFKCPYILCCSALHALPGPGHGQTVFLAFSCHSLGCPALFISWLLAFHMSLQVRLCIACYELDSVLPVMSWTLHCSFCLLWVRLCVAHFHWLCWTLFGLHLFTCHMKVLLGSWQSFYCNGVMPIGGRAVTVDFSTHAETIPSAWHAHVWLLASQPSSSQGWWLFSAVPNKPHARKHCTDFDQPMAFMVL